MLTLYETKLFTFYIKQAHSNKQELHIANSSLYVGKNIECINASVGSRLC